MSAPQTGAGRLRAYSRFLLAVVYFFVVRSIARHEAASLVSQQWEQLVEQALLALLLLLGYGALGLGLDRQQHPIAAQGFPLRPGWVSETGLGVAFGWGVAVVCVVPMALAGGIAVILSLQPSAWVWLLVDMAFFALAALVEEIAFRGYAFQHFVQSVGPVGATAVFAVFYAIVQTLGTESSRASVAVSLALALLLSTAYLRSRALWLSWGINFSWKASRALVFGLAVSGVNGNSPVVQGNPMGPFWLTGGGFGLDGSWLTFFVLLAALPVLHAVTRDLDYRFNAPVIVPAGIPVDLDAAARQQHQAASPATESDRKPLVQILPASSVPQAGPEQPPSDATIQH